MKSNIKLFKYIFWILIVSSVILIINTLVSNFHKFTIHGFGGVDEPVIINLSLQEKLNSNITFCYGTYCKQPTENPGYVYYTKYDKSDKHFKNIDSLALIYEYNDKNFENKIENIQVFAGYKYNYYTKKEIQNFKYQYKKINSKNYKIINLPDIKNYRGHLNASIICFLSLFYNWKYFILPYLYLFLAGIIYILKGKEICKFSFSFNNKTKYFIFGLTVLLGILVRINNFTYYPLWKDEAYAKVIALKGYISLFQDPGNPPLFFIIEKIFTMFFGDSNFILRLPSLLFGIILIFMTFFFFKKYDKSLKLSLLATFLISINTVAIYNSQDCKSVALCMILCMASTYYLFNYLENTNKKNLIIYSLISICAVNTHYYLVFYAFGNFLWILYSLIKNNKTKELKGFIIANIIIFVAFIPYFYSVASIALNNKFDDWIVPINRKVIHTVVKMYFYNEKILILFLAIVLLQITIAYLIKKDIIKNTLKINKDKKYLFQYLLFSIFFVVFASTAVSLIVKPIFANRIFLSIYILLFMLEIILISTIFNFEKTNKQNQLLKYFYTLLILIIIFKITSVYNIRELFSFDHFFMKYIEKDVENLDNKYEIHAVTDDTLDYVNFYDNIKNNKKIIWHIVDSTNTVQEFNLYKYDNISHRNPYIIYIRRVGLKNNPDKEKSIKVFETINFNFAKVKYK